MALSSFVSWECFRRVEVLGGTLLKSLSSNVCMCGDVRTWLSPGDDEREEKGGLPTELD